MSIFACDDHLSKKKDLSEDEWLRILESARRHSVGPLLFSLLWKAGTDRLLPPSITEPLRQKYLATAVSNARRFHLFSEIVSEFQQQGIPVIPLKGTHLAHFVYPDPGARPMSDLDILVKPGDLHRAASRLFELGYGFRDYKTGRIEADKSLHYPIPPGQMHFRALHHRSSRNVVELHHAITYADSPFTIHMDGIWRRARPASIDAIEMLTMHPEDLLLHLSLHLAYQHRFDATSFRALFDIKAVLDAPAPPIDEDRLIRRAREWRVHRALFLCLYFVQRFFNSSPARALLEKRRTDDLDEQLAETVQTRIFHLCERTEEPPHYIPGLKEAVGMKSKIRYILKSLFPDKDVISVRYLVPPGSSRIYLYYLVRMADYVRDHTSGVWRIIRRDPGLDAGMERKLEEGSLRRWLEG